MKLSDVFLQKAISDKFDSKLQFEILGTSDVEKIAKREPEILFEIGAQAWMTYVESKAKVNPKKLSSLFDSKSPFLYQKVEKEIKRKVIQDIAFCYANIQDPTIDARDFIQLLLCRMYPNDLFIADVCFYDPYKPVPPQDREYALQYFRSLGLFEEHLKSIKSYCKEHSISKITLTTSSNEQIPYFERHGFKIESSDYAKTALENGHGVPMHIKLINP
ncbi:hypothetical protein [Vibrio sp. R78045]|uniref:hypothetical protein n=1 Tax=Vibrio sp. R78045 TaxID=3093868 RepID=UPI0036F3B152